MQSVNTKLAVIIPNWNGKETLEACLSSLLKQSFPIDIIVVDNGSTDGSADFLASHFPRVRVIHNKTNLGFAGGVNTGIRATLDIYEYVGLFNNDAVADARWAESLVAAMERQPEAGIATGLLLSRDGATIDTTGEQYSHWGLPFPRQRGEPVGAASKDGPTFGATGGASLYRTAMLKDIGLFDETFFAYYEDADISFRAQLKGYSVIYTGQARAYHEHGTTSRTIPGFTVLQTFKNLPMLYFKNVPLRLLLSVGIRFWLAYTLIFANAIKNGHTLPAVKGVMKSVSLLPHSIRERSKIQSTKTVSWRVIASLLWTDLPPDQQGIRRLRKAVTGK